MTAEREKIIALARDFGLDTEYLENEFIAFYKAAQAEALRNSKVQVPTNTMEQEFSNYHRLGYNKGMAEAFERAAAACDCVADGWENNPGNNPMAGYVASSNCAAAIREMAKEMK